MSAVTILVVDDNELFRLELATFLKKRGFSVNEAQTGDRGLEMALKNPPDVVLTDLVMPDLDGLEGIKRLRAALPKTTIFAMSGGGRRRNVDLLNLAAKIGANAVFEKPLNMKAVLQAMEALQKNQPGEHANG